MAKEPGDRFCSAHEMADALMDLVGDERKLIAHPVSF